MIRYSTTIAIDRPPSEVYAALLDPNRYSAWTEMVDASFDSMPPRVGTTGQFRLAQGPIKGMLRMRVTSLEPDRLVGFEIDHPSLFWRATNVIEPDGLGSRLVYAGEISLRGWRRLIEPLMAGEVRAGEAKEAERLKELLERQPAAAAAMA